MQNGVDRSHGYIKDPEPGWWSKMNLKTGEVVSRIRVNDEDLPKRLGNGAYGGHGHSHNHGYHPHVPYVAPNEKDWQYIPKQLDEYDWINSCGHKGVVGIWAYQGVTLYAAGMGGIEPGQYDLVLDLARQLTPYRKKGKQWQSGVILDGSPTSYMALNKWALDYRGERLATVPKPEPQYDHVVHLKWHDGSAPDVDPEFWIDLWNLLPKPGKILACCIGGHGRTGTALAALMMVSGDPSIASSRLAVLTVRARHCEHAIETKSQLNYLDKVATSLGLVANAHEAQKVLLNKSNDVLEHLLEKGEC